MGSRPLIAWVAWVTGELIRATGSVLWISGWVPLPRRRPGFRDPEKRTSRVGMWLGSAAFRRALGKTGMAFPVDSLVKAVLRGEAGLTVIGPHTRLVIGGVRPRQPLSRPGGDLMEEKRKILDMVAAGKITAEEGLRLLEALEKPEKHPAKPHKKGNTLLIEVHDLEDDEHVLVRIPLSLIQWAMKAGLSLKTIAAVQVKDPEVRRQVEQAFRALNELDFDRLVEEVQEAGDLVRVDSDEARVSIRVE